MPSSQAHRRATAAQGDGEIKTSPRSDATYVCCNHCLVAVGLPPFPLPLIQCVWSYQTSRTTLSLRCSESDTNNIADLKGKPGERTNPNLSKQPVATMRSHINCGREESQPGISKSLYAAVDAREQTRPRVLISPICMGLCLQ